MSSYYTQPRAGGQREFSPQTYPSSNTPVMPVYYSPPGATPSYRPNYRQPQSSPQVQYSASAYPSPPSDSPGAPQPKQKPKFVCIHPDCHQTAAFDRKADLQRHYERMHNPSPQLFDCPLAGQDNCTRYGSNGLPRRDKVREHLREMHKQPIPKRQHSK